MRPPGLRSIVSSTSSEQASPPAFGFFRSSSCNCNSSGGSLQQDSRRRAHAGRGGYTRSGPRVGSRTSSWARTATSCRRRPERIEPASRADEHRTRTPGCRAFADRPAGSHRSPDRRGRSSPRARAASARRDAGTTSSSPRARRATAAADPVAPSSSIERYHPGIDEVARRIPRAAKRRLSRPTVLPAVFLFVPIV